MVYLGVLAVLALVTAVVATTTSASKPTLPVTVQFSDSQPTTAIVPETTPAGSEVTTSSALPTASPATPPSVAEAPSAGPTSSGVPAVEMSQASQRGHEPLEVRVDDCVTAGGAVIEKADCGSPASGYRVIGKTDASGPGCPADTDQVREHAGGTLCLDIDWIVGGCLMLVEGPRRIDCGLPGIPGGLRVLTVLRGTTDVNRCATGDRGVVYRQRQFVVCVADL